MKKIFSLATVGFTIFLFGCTSVPSQQMTSPEPATSVLENQSVPTEKSSPVPNSGGVTETSLSFEEARDLAIAHIKNLPEYKNGGTHLEEIDSEELPCAGCYEFRYEFRVQDSDANVTDVNDVKVVFADGKITDTSFENYPAPKNQIANPASVNCEDKGGKLEIRTDATGGQFGVCIFSDGTECEEWAFFRGECSGVPLEKKADSSETVCTTEYAPVCAKVAIQCIKAPCDPIWETVSNRCEAEKLLTVEILERTCEQNGKSGSISSEPAKEESIRVMSPVPGSIVGSPLSIEGEARGTWFFEGQFPVRLLDERGNPLASGFAEAQGEWMTENFVPFSVTLEFTPPVGMQGTLILEKDNPSGLPENDQRLEVLVKF